MYYLKCKYTISSAHSLNLDYESACKNLHGHNWKITVYCKSDKLNEDGMIIDFRKIKGIIDTLDHQLINNYIKQPTAENIAKWLADNIPFCYKIEVKETDNNSVVYDKDV